MLKGKLHESEDLHYIVLFLLCFTSSSSAQLVIKTRNQEAVRYKSPHFGFESRSCLRLRGLSYLIPYFGRKSHGQPMSRIKTTQLNYVKGW